MFSKVIVLRYIIRFTKYKQRRLCWWKKFQYTKKLTTENTAGIILNNNGTNINSQARHFIKRINDDWFSKVSGSAYCQRKQQLRPEVFKDENDKLIRNIYKELEYLHKYNGKTLLTADTSIITLSNHTTTKEKFVYKYKINAKNIIPRARISCITDTLTNNNC